MRQISMAKKGPRWASAVVTRRDGWLDLTVGTDLEVVEWSPRVGARWVCEECGWLGPKRWDPHLPPVCERCEDGFKWRHRKPRRLGVIRVFDVTREPLGAILLEKDGCLREGFPELDPWEFCRLYLGGKSLPEVSSGRLDRMVTRIVYRVVEVF